ncbi:nuclease SbcCD subunit C [Geobacter sp. OR-1]|uniref:AAA family ATPase n=1 Tax=Geobacter sp. OR-1 TaxID=1266765 RepID=UPI00054246FC|nr:AAA family ATPase [Geobacter sp. OR-1]GAM10424.1 nuclease SbcCD subunit C [Geobacter sp. OR-1]
MRPLKLYMQAFGPFAGKQEINFALLGEKAFFLIQGPTGAGKTSILDAVCYALYGTPSGSTRDEHTLRSQHAPKDLLCEVEFLFQVGPRRFHIKRSPEQTLLKKGKEQKSLHKVELCEVDADGAVIDTPLYKVGDIRERIEQVLGFTADQFRQVVILPQGEFRKLLLASSADKEKILEKLFATERFKRIENELKERSAALARSLEGIRNTIRGILEGQEVVSPSELEAKQKELEQLESELSVKYSAAAASLQEAAEALQKGHIIEEKFLRLEKAQVAVSGLAGERESIEKIAVKCERGKRALSLDDFYNALTRDRHQSRDLATRISELDESLVKMRGELSVAKGDQESMRKLAAEIPAKTAEKAGLEGRLRLIEEVTVGERKLKEAVKARKAASDEFELVQKNISALEAWLAEAGERIEDLAREAGQRGEVGERLKGVESQAASARKLAGAADREVKLAKEQGKLADQYSKAEADVVSAVAIYEGLSEKLIHGQAARLAKELHDGAPCPVCGSLEHPAPAGGAENVPTDLEIEAAKLAVETAREKLDQVRGEAANHNVSLGEARSEANTLRQQLGSAADTSVAILDEEIKRLKLLFTDLVSKEKELETARASRAGEGSKLEEARKSLTGKAEALQKAAAQADLLAGQLQAKSSELGDGERDSVAVKKLIADIETFIVETSEGLKTADGLAERLERESSARQGERDGAVKSSEELTERLGKGEKTFADRMAKAGFADEEEYRASGLTGDELERLEQKVAVYREKVAAASAEQTQAGEACSGLTRPDLHSLTSSRTSAEDALTAIAEEQGREKSLHETIRSSLLVIEKYQKESADQEQQYRVVSNLSNLASGNNSKRITLQRYVLASLFEEVATAASARLSLMSRGRYHLRRSETVTDARKGAGLDLEVTDDFTGQRRPASSLSGGETFLASLSLALGLSDIVLAQSGGRYLDTLFIDEGFGTLDQETLDIAMDTLVRLNEQGRMVGIISHVAELKEQIPSRLEVVSGRCGSKVHMVF